MRYVKLTSRQATIFVNPAKVLAVRGYYGGAELIMGIVPTNSRDAEESFELTINVDEDVRTTVWLLEQAFPNQPVEDAD